MRGKIFSLYLICPFPFIEISFGKCAKIGLNVFVLQGTLYKTTKVNEELRIKSEECRAVNQWVTSSFRFERVFLKK